MNWTMIVMIFIGLAEIVVICSICFKINEFIQNVNSLREKYIANETKLQRIIDDLGAKLEYIMNRLDKNKTIFKKIEMKQKEIDEKTNEMQDILITLFANKEIERANKEIKEENKE